MDRKSNGETKPARKKNGESEGAASYNGTMQEIADRCKLSKVTVSRAFTAPHLVRQATRDRVFATAREIGYTYNALAATLGRATRPFLGIIASHHNDSQFQSVMRAAHNAATDMGLEALLSVTELDQEKERDLIQRYFEYRAAAIIVFGPTRWLASNVARMQPRPTCPILVIGEKIDSEDVSWIGVDIEAASFSLVSYLHGLGHRNIALVCGPHLVSSRSQARLRGYVRGLEHFSLPMGEDYVYATRSGLANNMIDLIDEGRNAVTQFLSRGSRPTAIIFPSDQHTLGGMLALQKENIAIPGEISLVSMSENKFSHWISPALTALRLPTLEMADLVRNFLTSAVNETIGITRQCIPVTLIERESSGPPPVKR
ncbi:MAG: HTH-type transcriptional regulator AscG [Desulfovibrio sp.]